MFISNNSGEGYQVFPDPNEEEAFFDSLPSELLGHIFSFCSGTDLGKNHMVCTIWLKHADNPLLWESLCKQLNPDVKRYKGFSWKTLCVKTLMFNGDDIIVMRPVGYSGNIKNNVEVHINQKTAKGIDLKREVCSQLGWSKLLPDQSRSLKLNDSHGSSILDDDPLNKFDFTNGYLGIGDFEYIPWGAR
jgi:hypothetical protein